MTTARKPETIRQWHGPHLVIAENQQETERLGSITAEPVDPPMAYVAAGLFHRLRTFNTFGDAQQYLEAPGNRRAVENWEGELIHG
jgi:hypothetical protein